MSACAYDPTHIPLYLRIVFVRQLDFPTGAYAHHALGGNTFHFYPYPEGKDKVIQGESESNNQAKRPS